MSDTRDREIAFHYQEGSSLRAIAKDFDMSHESVRKILMRLGVSLRTTKARKLDGALRSLSTPIG